jgi:hypothetical protein
MDRTVSGSLHEVMLDLVDVDDEVNILGASGRATVYDQDGAQEGKWAVLHYSNSCYSANPGVL